MSSTETGQNSQSQNSGSQPQSSGPAQGASQQQQQIQTTTGNPIHGQQQLQVIQQPLQNSYLQPFYNQNQLQLMPGNILHHGINPQIQVITAGGNRLQNQLSFPTAGASYTIPTSAANNQPFTIIGQLINSQQSLQQQIAAQQGGKPGDMQKVLSPQIGTQLPQGLTWASPFLTTGGNQIFIRGTQPNVDQMFIQQQQPLHNTTSTHQHFSMPLTTNAQIPTTSISQQQQQQGQNQSSAIQNQQLSQQQSAQQQQQQQQIQAQSQIQSNNNMVSIKTPLQPKPLQIQPNNQQQQQQQQQHQQNHITMTQMTQAPTHQIQMLPTTTHQLSQGQSISMTPLSQQATITAQVIQAQQHLQQQQQGGPRHLTILPQQQHQIQPQLIQQVNMNTTTQHQPIRPNISVGLTITSSPATPVNSPTTTNAHVNMPTPRGKQPRKAGVGRGASNGSPQGKQPIYQQRGPSLAAINTMQSKPLSNTTISGSTITKVGAGGGVGGGNSPLTIQPLKTINLSALQSPPNLPDATLTPLLPQSNSVSITGISQSQSGLRVFPTSTQLPNPNISIVPANMPIMQQQQAQHQTQNQQIMNQNQNQNQFNVNSNVVKKEDSSEMKSEIEKENETEETGNKSKLPKAMVKPSVLTHVLEGFVIQEASEPFPMVKQNGDTNDEPPKKKMLMNGSEMAKCEMCNKVDLKSKFKKNKRFCSTACVKNMKLQQQHQQNQTQQQVKDDMNAKPNNKNKKWTEGGDGDMTDETSSSIGEMEKQEDNEEPKISPYKWSVSDVVDFVKSLPGCAEYAEDFAIQEIDGQALVLLKEAHLMSAIGMKLGTALKLCEKIRQAQNQIPK